METDKKLPEARCLNPEKDYINDLPDEVNFITSDDFHLVQNKKKCRKLNSKVNSQDNFEGVKEKVKEAPNHKSFWHIKQKKRALVTENEEQSCDTLLKCEMPESNNNVSESSEAKFLFKDYTVVTENDTIHNSKILNGSSTTDNTKNLTCLSGPDLSYTNSGNFQTMNKNNCDKEINKFDANMKASNTLIHVESKAKNKIHKKAKKKCSRGIDDDIEQLLKELDATDECKKNKKISKKISSENMSSNGVEIMQSTQNKNSSNVGSMQNEVPNIVQNGDEIIESERDVKDLTQENCIAKNEDMKAAVNCDGNSTSEGPKICDNHSVKTKTLRKKKKKEKQKQQCLEKSENCSQSTLESLEKVLGDSPKDITDVLKDDAEINKSKTKKGAKSEPEKKDKKRLGKKQLAAIQEALKKAKDEEERLLKEQEAKLKAAQEAERIRQENIKLELEKRERRQIKAKEKKEKMKAEGRSLSKSQKQARARMEVTLEALRQQGIDVPQIGEKRPERGNTHRSGNYRSRRRLDSSRSTQSNSSGPERNSVSISSQDSLGKDSLSDILNSFNCKDSPDISPVEGFSMVSEHKSGCIAHSNGFVIRDQNRSLKDIQLTNVKQKTLIGKHNCTEAKATNESKVSNDTKENASRFRSPIVCVLGHVDTGKTKILDFIRKTHVQDGEAGGITQQIGATMIPQEAIREKCKMVNDISLMKFKVPGLLVIDTPGHESFSNLRSRGSSVCDIAILVVDIMHGLEPQTIESINLLKKDKIPFIVALNKIDRIYGWKSSVEKDIENVINCQSQNVLTAFRNKCNQVIVEFAKLNLNAALFYENNDPRAFVSMVPTSAISGDGMGNLLWTVVNLTQSMMAKKFIFSNELKATVLEVKAISGLGTTIDVILVNGRLREGDAIVLAGHDGPITTQIRSLLMPQPLRELRVKNPYVEYKQLEGAQGIKITGKDLDKAVAGLPLFVCENHAQIDSLKSKINCLINNTINSFRLSERGVYVQASTLGSLEALLEYLKSSQIPFSGIKIGPVVKKDVMKASVMLEHDNQFAVILAFDVKIERDAQELAENLGVKIFQADIIYHLFDRYVEYQEQLLEKKQNAIKQLAIFPCKLKILPGFILNVKDPNIISVLIEEGNLHSGTPLCIPSRENIDIGTVTVIEVNQKQVDSAKQGDEVRIRIEPKHGETPKVFGRHFDQSDLLVSRITRQSIDICKEHFRDVLSKSDWSLVIELKKILQIV